MNDIAAVKICNGNFIVLLYRLIGICVRLAYRFNFRTNTVNSINF